MRLAASFLIATTPNQTVDQTRLCDDQIRLAQQRHNGAHGGVKPELEVLHEDRHRYCWTPMGSSNSSTCGRLNSPRQDERIKRRIPQ